jgi:hypothetical protein
MLSTGSDSSKSCGIAPFSLPELGNIRASFPCNGKSDCQFAKPIANNIQPSEYPANSSFRPK